MSPIGYLIVGMLMTLAAIGGLSYLIVEVFEGKLKAKKA